ncbi:MAG: PAS domain S-box protein [Bacteroidales bacterium]|nr:PAS domain S-box protein [Bacteroidales bacterium]
MEILDDFTSTILHNLDEGLAIVDTSFNKVYNNKVLNHILELPDDKEANVFDYVSGDDMAIIKTLLSQTSGTKVNLDIKITSGQGNPKVLRLSISSFFNTKRNADGYIVSVNDRTDEEKDKIALKAAMSNLDLVANSTADVILRYDFRTFEMSFVSKSIKYMAGYDYEELLGTRCVDIFHPSVRQPIIDTVTSYVNGTRSFARGGHDKIRLPMLKKDGTCIMTEVLSSFLRDSNDRPIDCISIIHDISESLRYEKQISEQNNVMNTLINNLISDVYLKDKNLKYKMANLRYAKSIGFDSVEQIIDKTDSELGIEGSIGIEKFEQHILNTANPSFNIEKKITDKDGSEKWISTSKLSYKNNDGQISGVIGVVRDITKQKNYEQTILERTRQFENTINTLTDVYVKTDTEGKIVEVSPSVCALYGCKHKTEIIGKNFFSTLCQIDYDYNIFVDEIKAIGRIDGFSNKLVNLLGQEKYVESNLVTWVDSENQIAGFEGIIHDITERVVREKTIESQKRTIELAHQATIESINAAKRTQSAIMPFESLSNLFNSAFIIYRPKDIVGGDFFYAIEKEGKAIAAVGDCTGHGVSGALISTLSMSFLSNVISELSGSQLTSENILEELRAKVIKTMGNGSKEGFDISLIVVDKDKKQLQFSGAFNSLYFVRGGDLTEYHADKCPIGRYPKIINFQRNTIDYVDGDEVFLLSDGYGDQFGGPANRRFGSNKLREMFIEVSALHTSEQKEIIDRTLNDWMAQQTLGQIDDVTVMGIKF